MSLRVDGDMHSRGIPARYLNHSDHDDRSAVLELGKPGSVSPISPSLPLIAKNQQQSSSSGAKNSNTGSSSSRSRRKNRQNPFDGSEFGEGRVLGHPPSLTSASSTRHSQSHPNFEQLLVDQPKLPQITVSDNDMKELGAIEVVSDDEYYGEMEDKFGSELALSAHLKEHLHSHTEPASPSGGGVYGIGPQVVPMKQMTMEGFTRGRPQFREDVRSYRSDRSDEASIRSLRRAGYKREKMPVSVGIITVILFITGGAVLFAVWEDWNFFDGAYYSFITLSTIGFGDIVPGQSLDEGSQEKLVVCALYLLFGMALIAMCFKLMQDDVVQKARWLGQRIGIIVKEESSDSDSEFDDDIVIEDDDDDLLSEEKNDQDKRTVSSGSSKRDEDDMRPSNRYERNANNSHSRRGHWRM
uniref:Potassium channel domain-containing protein n=1 Tax=Ditylenchus dipsaci TaxID=166011 RepID=A0A915D0E7_9BILA